MYSIKLDVRDYECDMQGRVNNAVYQNYFEHARHEFLQSKGLSFAKYTLSGINLVIYRAEIDYLAPLRSGDRFEVSLEYVPISKIRCSFNQEIKVRDKVYAKGVFFVTALGPNEKPIPLDSIVY